ncbi:hypothetical protein CPC08DRAFT_808667 [Agrocybe pediades]|nr:hypothetical protein CPC08DRAFT_808667 [Agrocybe pediades]
MDMYYSMGFGSLQDHSDHSREISSSEDDEGHWQGLGNHSDSEASEMFYSTSEPTDMDDEEIDYDIPTVIQVERTHLLRSRLKSDEILSKVLDVLNCIASNGLDLPLFLDAVSWGSPDCHSHRTVQYARTALLASDELLGILQRWYKPPRRANEGRGRRPTGARETLHKFAFSCILDKVDEEMHTSAHLFASPSTELSEKHLLSLDFQDLQDKVQVDAPVLWKIIKHAATSQRKEVPVQKKNNPDLVAVSCIAQMQYSRSRHQNKFQKVWSMYFKACGLSARAFDAVHALGLSMSHRWAIDAYGTLSDRAMKEVQQAVLKKPWHISHDNVNIPLRVFSQRLDNQSRFISATAATIWVLPDRALLPANTNPDFNRYRALHSQTIFKYEDILYGQPEKDKRIKAQHQHRILMVLLQSSDFADYKHHGNHVFNPPPPVEQLPIGPDNAIRQYVLGTAEEEEASYEGTLKVMAEFMKQLNLHTTEEEKKTATGRFIAWIGDQLTVDRLRGLWKYRHEDHNSFDRMDYMLPVFGWFHLVMALANSLHKQYLGTASGTGGLRHAFDLLKRKGLVTQATKGPFWHHLDEAIHHISDAHFRAAWIQTSGVESLAELKKKTPTQLKSLAEDVYHTHCSRIALTRLEAKKEPEQDHVRKQWIMWNCDVLPYLELRDAIKAGDVGRMEDLLPVLLFRFAGGGNSKYAIEILELLQGLHQEWPDGVKNYVKTWCWLMNRTGKENNYLPYDLGQEETIADIKVNYRSLGPGATMEYMKKVSPIIPVLKNIQRHIENQFKTTSRGARHGSPDAERDIALLTAQYVKSKIYEEVPGREVKNAADKSLDFKD